MTRRSRALIHAFLPAVLAYLAASSLAYSELITRITRFRFRTFLL